jgi:N-methylhydantoinase A
VIGIANAMMTRAIRSVTTSRGRDPREFVLLAFGGGGGLHAVALAAALGVTRVLVPPAAGVFSALGLLFSDIEFTQSQGMLVALDVVRPECLTNAFASLEKDVLQRLGRPPSAVRLRRRVDLRYAGQAFELTVDAPDWPLNDDTLGRLADAFDAEHARTYGHSLPRAHKREIVALRVVGTVVSDRPPAEILTVGRGSPTDQDATRQAYFGEHGWLETRIVSRAQLREALPGPLIVEEADSSAIVPPGWTAELDGRHNIVITDMTETQR